MSKLSTPRRPLAAFVVAASAVIAISACGDNKFGPSVPASVTAASGDSQTILVGNRPAAPLVIVVKNSGGSPLPNVPVAWTVASGGGSLFPVEDTTDVNGQAHVNFLSPAIAGKVQVRASAGGQSHTFTLHVVADTTGIVTAFGGNGAAGLVGSQITLAAKAVDRFGNPISGVALDWSASNGTLKDASTTTDTTGVSKNVLTVGPNTGQASAQAASRFNTATFTVDVLPSPP